MHYDVTVTSYMGCLYFFGMYGKKRPIAIPWYPIGISRGVIFQVHGGCNNPHLGKIYVMRNGLVIGGLMPSLNFSDNLLQDTCFIFFKNNDNFEIAYKTCLISVWGVVPP